MKKQTMTDGKTSQNVLGWGWHSWFHIQCRECINEEFELHLQQIGAVNWLVAECKCGRRYAYKLSGEVREIAPQEDN